MGGKRNAGLPHASASGDESEQGRCLLFSRPDQRLLYHRAPLDPKVLEGLGAPAAGLAVPAHQAVGEWFALFTAGHVVQQAVPEPANPVPVMWRDAVHPQMQPVPHVLLPVLCRCIAQERTGAEEEPHLPHHGLRKFVLHLRREETPGLLCQLRGLLLFQMLRRHAPPREPTAAQVHVGQRVRWRCDRTPKTLRRL